MASESHSIRRVEGPMTISVSKIYLVDQETKGERSTHAKVVIFIADMYSVYIQLNTIKHVCDEAETNGLFKLIICGFLGSFCLFFLALFLFCFARCSFL